MRRKVRRSKNSGNVFTGRPANFNRRHTKGSKNGDYLVQCDITGQVCKRSEARKTWRGLLVSKQNWDPRHPQLDLPVKEDQISVEDARPFQSSLSAAASASVQLTDITVTFSQISISDQRVSLS